jgi:hypothetical protein
LLALQALSRDLLCGDNELLSYIANYYARCLFRFPEWGRWIICRRNGILSLELPDGLDAARAWKNAPMTVTSTAGANSSSLQPNVSGSELTRALSISWAPFPAGTMLTKNDYAT